MLFMNARHHLVRTLQPFNHIDYIKTQMHWIWASTSKHVLNLDKKFGNLKPNVRV
jgi:hypothetical protein